MKRAAAILMMLTCLVHGQTYLTVTADTNRVIRTNFTLSFGQVTFAGGGTNAVPVVSGGTGATNAAAALVNLLPSYTGNSNKVLGLNSNATAIIWTTNGGGGGGTGIESRITASGGISLATVSGQTNLETNFTGAGFIAGSGASATGFEAAVAVGQGAKADSGTGGTAGGAIGYYAESFGGAGAVGGVAVATNGGGAIGYLAKSYGGGFAGGSNVLATNGGAAIGRGAEALAEGGAVGRGAIATQGGAVGRFAYTINGAAVGRNAYTKDGVAVGYNASADGTNVVQLGEGDNETEDTIQFLDAGLIDKSEWGSLANAGTIGTNVLQSTNAAGAQAAIFPATTTNSPTNTNAPTPTAWLDVTVGTNSYKLPLWQ